MTKLEISVIAKLKMIDLWNKLLTKVTMIEVLNIKEVLTPMEIIPQVADTVVGLYTASPFWLGVKIASSLY